MTFALRVCASAALAGGLLIMGAGSVSAQDKSVGLMVAAPTLIGIDLPLSAKVAVRPGFSYGRSSSAYTTVAGHHV